MSAEALDRVARAAGVRSPRQITGPFELRDATRDGTGNDGGILDRGIVGRVDGLRAVIGELWAMGPNENGERVSLDVLAFGDELVWTLNTHSDFMAAARAAIAYDAAIQRHAAKGESWTDGADLDALYADWIDKSRAALVKAEGAE